MLMDRLFEPSVDDVIYHYCSAAAFQAIIESRRLRFTDVNMLNDAQESKWGYSVFEEAATRLLTRETTPHALPQVDLAFLDAMDELIASVQLIAHPFVACLSMDSDSLPQWRAYADDGRGFAIGFSAKSLSRMPSALLKVEYNRDVQVNEMMAAIVATLMHLEGREPSEPVKEFETRGGPSLLSIGPRPGRGVWGD